MFQTHCYDAWLGGSARNSTFFMWSQLGGTFPAPLFLFLAGTSFALVTDKLVKKGLSANRIAKAKFSLDGKTYQLAANNGVNHLHGGVKGWDQAVWKAEPFQDALAARPV